MNVKPKDRSKIGLWNRGVQVNIPDHASLRFGTDDLMVAFWVCNVLRASTCDATFKKTGGGPLFAVSRIGDERFRLWMTDHLANAVDRDFWLNNEESAFIHIWVNRSTGYADVYEDGALLLHGDFTAVVGNIDPTGSLTLHGDNFPNASELLYLTLYDFGVGGLPSVADQSLIMSQHLSDPYTVPVGLADRAAYATEERLRVTFDNCDPGTVVIPDESTYANNGALSAGTCATALREYGSV